MLPKPLTYRVSEESYLQEPPCLFSYKLATSLELVMNLKQTSLCPVGWVWKENLWVLKLVQWISSCLSSFCCIILSCCNRFVLESRGAGMQPGFHNASTNPSRALFHLEGSVWWWGKTSLPSPSWAPSFCSLNVPKACWISTEFLVCKQKVLNKTQPYCR